MLYIKKNAGKTHPLFLCEKFCDIMFYKNFIIIIYDIFFIFVLFIINFFYKYVYANHYLKKYFVIILSNYKYTI